MAPWNRKNYSKTISTSTARPSIGKKRTSAWTWTTTTRNRSRASSESLPQSSEPERRHRLQEAAQLQRPHRLGVGERGDLLLGLGVEQNLAGARLAAQARRQVRHVADRGILPALLEADYPEGGLALGDADSEPHRVAELFPGLGDRHEGLLQGERHAHRALARPVHRERVVEEDHHAVAGEVLQRA